jgi:hypothetical protein
MARVFGNEASLRSTSEPESMRIFQCGRDDCRVLVVLCTLCDHGHRYCSVGCSKEARRCSRRRYAKGSRARLKRTARSARYRARRRSKVTDTPVQEFDFQATHSTRAAETIETSSMPAARSEVSDDQVEKHKIEKTEEPADSSAESVVLYGIPSTPRCCRCGLEAEFFRRQRGVVCSPSGRRRSLRSRCRSG